MKALLSALGIVALTVLVSLTATSEEQKQPKAVANNPYEDLRSTLSEAYGLRLEEYKSGRSTSANVIRVNQELYEIERQVKVVGKETEPQETYVARSREIEVIANEHVTNGIGSKPDVLDAKTARLRAEMALYSAANEQ